MKYSLQSLLLYTEPCIRLLWSGMIALGLSSLVITAEGNSTAIVLQQKEREGLMRWGRDVLWKHLWPKLLSCLTTAWLLLQALAPVWGHLKMLHENGDLFYCFVTAAGETAGGGSIQLAHNIMKPSGILPFLLWDLWAQISSQWVTMTLIFPWSTPQLCWTCVWACDRQIWVVVDSKECFVSHTWQSNICICLAVCRISFSGWFCNLKLLSFIEALPG